MPVRVVYIHGIGSKPQKDELKKEWDYYLLETNGLSIDPKMTSMAYWADILHPKPDPAPEYGAPITIAPSNNGAPVVPLSTPSPSFSPPAGMQAHGFARWLIDLGNAIHLASDYIQDISDHLLTGIAQMESKCPDLICKPAQEAIYDSIVNAFLADTAIYFNNVSVRSQIRNRLMQEILPILQDGQPFILLAHSLGTVISHDVLSLLSVNSHPAFDPALVRFVTIGCPLGIAPMENQLEKPNWAPTLVNSWNNIAEVLDPVALVKDLDGLYYRADPGDFDIVDRPLSLFGEDHPSLFDPHAASGYLSSGCVQGVVKNLYDEL